MSAIETPCPEQSDCYGPIENCVPYPFHAIDIGIGYAYQGGEIIGFSDEYTAIVRFESECTNVDVYEFL